MEKMDQCDGDSEAGWEGVLEHLEGINMKELSDLDALQPVAGEDKPTYTDEAISDSFVCWQEIITALIKCRLHDHRLRKRFYFHNSDPFTEWSWDLVCIFKSATVQTCELQLNQAKEDLEAASSCADRSVKKVPRVPHEPPKRTQRWMNGIVLSWWIHVYTKLSIVDWPRLVSRPDLGSSRPMVLRATLRPLYETWKQEVIKTIDRVLNSIAEQNQTPGKGDGDDDSEVSTETLPDEDREYLISYPDVRVDSAGFLLSSPKKEVAGSGLSLATKLGLDVLNPGNKLPPKYFQGEPQVGDRPLPGSFPHNVLKFADEDVFWLVVFYNDAFALQCRDRTESAAIHLFEVWWHLTFMAMHGGELPSRASRNEYGRWSCRHEAEQEDGSTQGRGSNAAE